MGRKSDAKARLLKAARHSFWSRSCLAVSVDLLCKEAGINKGSFYHFFPSKQALVLEALEGLWEEIRQNLFEPAFNPKLRSLARIEALFLRQYEQQKELKEAFGAVPGCPFLSIGSEMSSEDAAVRTLVIGILNSQVAYVEAALKEAAEKDFFLGDPVTTAQSTYSSLCGLLLRARIENRAEVILEGMGGAMALAGIRETAAVA